MRVLMRSGLAAVATAVASTAGAPPHRITLENGATVIVQSVPGLGCVGVESFYRAGFVHEPEGVTQAAHLVEHLACMGGLTGYAPGEAYARLNELGMSNAETLATFTHYDATASSANLEEVLRVEAARLSGITIDAPIIAQEAPRCYAEAVHVESSPQAPMFKFALMAANQAWRFGAHEALVKGGLVEAPIDRVRAFYTDRYTPSNLTVVIVGDTTRAEVEKIAGETIGRVTRREPAPSQPIEWANARDTTMRWDSSARVVIIAYPPPADETERLALSLRGLLAMQAFSTDPDLRKDAMMVLGSSHICPVGDLPFFVCATLTPGADAGAGERIDARTRAILCKEPSAAEMMQTRGFLDQMLKPAPLTASLVRQQARQIGPRMGLTEERAIGMVAGQMALHLGVGEMLLAGQGDAADGVKRMSGEHIAAIVKGTLNPERRIVTRLEPMQAK